MVKVGTTQQFLRIYKDDIEAYLNGLCKKVAKRVLPLLDQPVEPCRAPLNIWDRRSLTSASVHAEVARRAELLQGNRFSGLASVLVEL